MPKQNFFHFFSDVYSTNTYLYETKQSPENLKRKIKEAISQKGEELWRNNLSGELNEDATFEINGSSRPLSRIPRITVGPLVFIKGKIILKTENESIVRAQIRLSIQLLLYPIILTILGFWKIISFVPEQRFFGIAFFVIAIFLWFRIIFLKMYYKNEFEMALDLPENDFIVERRFRLFNRLRISNLMSIFK